MGAFGCLLFLGYFAFDSLLQSNSFISNGPLASSHANLENNCLACHSNFGDVTDDNCATCHELTGKKGRIYEFSAHYIYRTGNVQRIKSGQAKHAADEIQCFGCHPEHQGRMASITDVGDEKCLTCHDYGSFDAAHPEFEFERKQINDDTGLKFNHSMHLNDVIPFTDLVDKVENACDVCHVIQSDGKSFKPLDFVESRCGKSGCHVKDLGGFAHKNLGVLKNPKTKCQLCHQLSGATIVKTQPDQRMLTRAEFDHGPHLLTSACTDCHTNINESSDAAIQNVPTIANCQQCHSSKLTSNRCTTCHEFHPNKNLRFLLSQAQN